MKDGILEDFPTALSNFISLKTQPANAETEYSPTPLQDELNAHIIDIPFSIVQTAMRLKNASAFAAVEQSEPRPEISIKFDVGEHSAELLLSDETVSALATKALGVDNFPLVGNASGHLLIEHFLTSALNKIEPVVGESIQITAVMPAKSVPGQTSALSVAMLSDAGDVPTTMLKLIGSDEVAALFSKALMVQAPELAPKKKITPELSVCLRSPVFAIDDATADQLEPGDMLLLDERFSDLDSCRLWIEDAFSAAVRLESYGMMIMEEPKSETDALEGTHWHNDGVPGAGQIIIGEKKIRSSQIEQFTPEVSVPFTVHDLSVARLEITGKPPFEGRMLSLPGQWAFIVGKALEDG